MSFESSELDKLTSVPVNTVNDRTRYSTGQFNRDTLQLKSGEAKMINKIYEYNGQVHHTPNHPQFNFYTGAVVSSSTGLDVDMPVIVDNKQLNLDDVVLAANLYQQDASTVIETSRLHGVDTFSSTRTDPIMTVEGTEDQQTAVLKHNLVDGDAQYESSISVNKLPRVSDVAQNASGLLLQTQLINKGQTTESKMTITDGDVQIQSIVDDVEQSKVNVSPSGAKLSAADSAQYVQTSIDASIIGPATGTFRVDSNTILMHQLTRQESQMVVTDQATNNVLLKTDSQDPNLTADFDVVSPVVDDDSSMQVSVNHIVLYLKRLLDQNVNAAIERRLKFMSDDFLNLDDESIETDFQALLDLPTYLSLHELRQSLAIINKKVTAVVGVSPEHLNSIKELADRINAENGQYSLARELSDLTAQINNIYSMLQEVHPSSLTLDMARLVGAYESFLEQNYAKTYLVHNTTQVATDSETNLRLPTSLTYSSLATDALCSLSGPLNPTRQFTGIIAGKGLVTLYPTRFWYTDGSGIECTYDLTNDTDHYLKEVKLPNGDILNPFVSGFINPFGESQIGFLKDLNLGKYCFVDGFNFVNDFLPESRIYKEVWNNMELGYAQFKTFEEDKQHHSISENVLNAHKKTFQIDENGALGAFSLLKDRKVTDISRVRMSGPYGNAAEWPYTYIPVMAPPEEQEDFNAANFTWDTPISVERQISFSPVTEFDLSPGYAKTHTDILEYFGFLEQTVHVPSVYASDTHSYLDIICGQTTIQFDGVDVKCAKIMRICGSPPPGHTGITFTKLVEAMRNPKYGTQTLLNSAIFNFLNGGVTTDTTRAYHHSADIYYKPFIHHMHDFTTARGDVLSVNTTDKVFTFQKGDDVLTVHMVPLFTHTLTSSSDRNNMGETGMYKVVPTYESDNVTYDFISPSVGRKLQVYDGASYTDLQVDATPDANGKVWANELDGHSAVVFRSDWVLQMGDSHLNSFYENQM
jgi:hypothetical protein